MCVIRLLYPMSPPSLCIFMYVGMPSFMIHSYFLQILNSYWFPCFPFHCSHFYLVSLPIRVCIVLGFLLFLCMVFFVLWSACCCVVYSVTVVAVLAFCLLFSRALLCLVLCIVAGCSVVVGCWLLTAVCLCSHRSAVYTFVDVCLFLLWLL